MIYIKNARVFTPFVQKQAAVAVRGDVIEDVCEHFEAAEGDRVIDARGLALSPGLIDLHVHGGGGYSAITPEEDDITRMCCAHAAFGTTSILPTTYSAPFSAIRAAARAIARAMKRPCDANILGAHLEGPCLSPAQAGAQSPDDLLSPDALDLDAALETGIVRMMGVAPELPGALALGEALTKRGVVASIAHSDARYADVVEAVRHGYSDVTHLYSGCSGMIRVNSYRIPGVIEAGLNLDCLTCQVIADGKHLPLPLLQLIYRCKGAENMYLVTDGLEFSAAELAEGAAYVQKNGMEVVCEDGVMKLPSRQAFAGSVATMNRLVRTVVSAGVPVAQALRMASDTPARRLGLAKKGRIEKGCDADLAIFDADFNAKFVMTGGRVVKDALE